MDVAAIGNPPAQMWIDRDDAPARIERSLQDGVVTDE